jgi:hypothetical protein
VKSAAGTTVAFPASTMRGAAASPRCAALSGQPQMGLSCRCNGARCALCIPRDHAAFQTQKSLEQVYKVPYFCELCCELGWDAAGECLVARSGMSTSFLLIGPLCWP